MYPVWITFVSVGVLFVGARAAKFDIYVSLLLTLVGTAIMISSTNPLF